MVKRVGMVRGARQERLRLVIIEIGEQGTGVAVPADRIIGTTLGVVFRWAQVNPGVRGAQHQDGEQESNDSRGDQQNERALDDIFAGGGHRVGIVIVDATTVEHALHATHNVLGRL